MTKRLCLGTAFLLAVTSCTVGPDYVAPQPEVPDTWHMELTRGLASGDADLHTWWQIFEDPVLAGLVQQAFEGNYDLRRAVARVEQGRAGLGIAKGARVPSVAGVGSAQRTRFSDDLLGDLGSQGTDNLFRLGFDSSWELDFWGRVRRLVESAAADYQASVEAYRDTLVTLFADVAFRYIQVRTFQQRLVFVNQNVETQEGSLKLTQDLRRAGLVGDLDVRQAELNLARTEALIPRLEQRLATTIHRLSVLTGQLPSTLMQQLMETAPIPPLPPQVIVGLPAELLRQRPDIREAERALAAQTARIGVVTADLYPRFSISGTFTVDARRGSDLFNWSSRALGVGPTFQWNLFSGGRVRSRIEVEEARLDEAEALYEATVLRGYEEVANAMVAFVEEQERRDALQRSADAATDAVRLVDELYRLGLTDFQNVLDTQRTLFEQEDRLADSEGLVSQNLVRIYKSLGGGWAP